MPPPPETIVLYFDGACRRGAATACASGVFWERYDNKHSRGRILPNAKDSMEAEIYAATHAIITAQIILKEEKERSTAVSAKKKQRTEAGINTFVFRGDSMVIANAIKTGDILRFDDRLKIAKQAAAWAKLRTEFEKLDGLGFSIKWEWVPRMLNREADELCNAALDQREPNPNVKSETCANPVSTEQLLRILEQLSQVRRRTPRRLPDQLAKIWASFVFDIIIGYDRDPVRSRLLFLIAPHLVNVGMFPYVGGRSDFVEYRRHLHSLSNEVYLNEQLRFLAEELTNPPTPSSRPQNSPSELSETHLQSLCARGEYSKCYEEKTTSIAPFNDEVAAKIKSGIPDAGLPRPIDVLPNDAHEVTFAEVREAMRKLKRGKACGHSGWNRELLFPVLANPPSPVRTNLAKIFTDFINGLITESEAALFRSLVVIPMLYNQKPGKLRSIMITDGIVKMCWHILFLDLKDDRIDKSGQVFNQRGQATLGVCAIQAALEKGHIVVNLDAVNAFPSLRRNTFMDYIQGNRQYSKLKAFTNLMYSHVAMARFYDHTGYKHYDFPVTTGCLQGCVSGPRFYSMGTVSIALKHQGEVVMVADDTYAIGQNSLNVGVTLIEEFGVIGQKLDGPKMKLLVPPLIDLGSKVMPEVYKGATVITSPCEVLGGYVNPAPNYLMKEDDPSLLAKALDLERKCAKIVGLPMSKQCKLLVLRELSKSLIYRAQTYFHPQARQYFTLVDEIMYRAFSKLAKVEDRHKVRIFAPIEDGGLGLYPYEILHPFLQAQTIDIATEFLSRVGLELPCPPNATNSLATEWKKNIRLPRGGGLERDGRTFARTTFNSWLLCRPANRWTRLSDEAFSTQISIIFQSLKPFAVECWHDKQPFNPGTLPPEEFTHHILTCAVCTKQGFYLRHQSVLNAIRATLRFHGIHSYIPRPSELPLPDAQKGGPDLMVFAEGMDAVDVSIAATTTPAPGQNIRATMTDRFTTKIRKYQEFAKLTSYRVVPFVMSVYGLVCGETRELLFGWRKHASDPSFLFDLYNNVQMNLIRAQHEMIHYAQNRTKLNQAKRLFATETPGTG